MSKAAHFSSDFEAAEMHGRSHGDAWAQRLGALGLSLILAIGLILFYNSRRAIPDEVGLGKAVQIKPGVWNGSPINAHLLVNYAKTFPPPHKEGDDRLWIWLGNSQLHAINQLQENDEIAPVLASRTMGFPVFGLSLANASVREHYVVTAWTLSHSRPQWIILPVVFDKMRNYDLRTGFRALLDEETRKELESNPTGRTMIHEIEMLEAAQTADVQGTSRLGFSLQDITERKLNDALSTLCQIWRDRDQLYTRLMDDIYRLRNFTFRIKAQTKRPIITATLDANMAALNELLDLARRRGVKVLVYVAPTRWDVPPPYFLDKYDAWKLDLKQDTEAHGGYYSDMDHLVPDKFWGSDIHDDIDFMHFQGKAHALLADRVCEEIRKIEAGGVPPRGP